MGNIDGISLNNNNNFKNKNSKCYLASVRYTGYSPKTRIHQILQTQIKIKIKCSQKQMKSNKRPPTHKISSMLNENHSVVLSSKKFTPDQIPFYGLGFVFG